jgi:hypothetical protein
VLLASWSGSAIAQRLEQKCYAARFKAAGAHARCQTGVKAVEETRGTSIAFLKAAEACQERYAAQSSQFRKRFPATSCDQARYLDNGDGTVMDTLTGLQWERKRKLDGTVNLEKARDADNQYSWSAGGAAADGTAYTDHLAQLNSNCFAGHCDWRLPTFAELQTILDTEQGVCSGGSGACIDPIFGPTAPAFHWTSSSRIEPNLAAHGMIVDFGGSFEFGYVGSVNKFRAYAVRAVRGGLQ